MNGLAMGRTNSKGEPCQTVQKHLKEVAGFASQFAAKIGLPQTGELLGLVHDMGKYGPLFQASLARPKDDHASKPDHSTAGAQFIWQTTRERDALTRCFGQMLALCAASHHGGMMDCLSPDGELVFLKRMAKSEDKTCLRQALEKADRDITANVHELLNSGQAVSELGNVIESLKELGLLSLQTFHLGLVARFLFSALIDADRLSAAGRSVEPGADWRLPIRKLERHLGTFKQDAPVDRVRTQVSDACMENATNPPGLYRLTVPTGGGKTLASLRYALHHAARHDLERIIYVIPYTSIIDQNADVARKVLEDREAPGSVVLEHHSNLTGEKDTEEARILAENWDSPIIFTTLVQFLDALYNGTTRDARRMHRLAKAVLIFDEVQTLPVKVVHLFNNAINFLVGQCGSSAVFCTATQPLLETVDPAKGAAKFHGGVDAELAPSKLDLFGKLRRVTVRDARRPQGWPMEEVGELILEQAERSRTVLAITNTKAAALALYERCSPHGGHVFHLSTRMCPAHRMDVLGRMDALLCPKRKERVICISTQLIEAGVDIDFAAVVRFLAGLDSIAQAAGRCNRNGRIEQGRVTILNPREENLSRLPDIRLGCRAAERVLDEYQQNPDKYGHDVLHPGLMRRYYHYYFHERQKEMAYPVGRPRLNRNDTLFSLLSCNGISMAEAKRIGKSKNVDRMPLKQSFKSAGRAFCVIDNNTTGVIAPYEIGKEIIAELYGEIHDLRHKADLIRKAQRYTINLYPHELNILIDHRAVHEVIPEAGVYSLDEQFYDMSKGVVFEPSGQLPFLLA